MEVENAGLDALAELLEGHRRPMTEVDLFSHETSPAVPPPSPGTVLKDDEEEEALALTEQGRAIQRNLVAPPHRERRPKDTKTWKNTMKKETASNSRALSFDKFTGIRVKNPLVPFDAIQLHMQGRKLIKMSLIRNFTRNGDIGEDWVTFGVIVQKVPPKVAKNGKTFSIWKMSDLHDTERVVSVFLFGAAHAEHWKSSVGTVVGILNPTILPDKEKAAAEVSLSVDHAGRFLMVGTSKDLGFCKGQRRDGTTCRTPLNMSRCEFCSYHVKKEYRKLSSKRMELHSSYSGHTPGLKSKILKGQNIFYGGQMYNVPTKKQPSNRSSKDALTLSNLSMKRKAEAIENSSANESKKAARQNVENKMHKITEFYEHQTPKPTNNVSKFIEERLTIPSVGSRNLLIHRRKDEEKKVQSKNENAPDLSPMTILRQQCLGVPQLGRGSRPGQNIALDIGQRGRPKNFTQQELAKLKAVQKIKEKGPIAKKDPNYVKSSQKPKEAKVEAVASKVDSSPQVPQSCLGRIDLNSERCRELLQRGSSHAHEVEMREMEKQESYFDALEKKEQMELKMASTYELVCDVVSCKQCKYTAHHASEMCKEQNHPLKCHKAIKRFFCCQDCKRRTFAFTKFPKRSCRNCGGSNFERTGMMKSRTVTKFDNEALNIRGDEVKFLNSLC